MLTLPQIAQRTNRLRQEGSRYVRIIHMKKGWDSLGRGFVACSSYSTHIISGDGRPIKNTNPSRYITVITFLDTQLHVNISCSCGDFTYRWETALHHKSAADIEYSNGEWPVITNPQGRGWACKHLLALYYKIKPQLPAPRRK